MRRRILLAAIGAGSLGVMAGCATGTPVDGAAVPDRSATAGAGARWTANIRSVTQSRGEVMQTTRDRSYGSATWERGESESVSNVNLVFTYAGQERFLAWAILPGSCGTSSLPVLPMANFAEINVGGGGRGQVTTSLPLGLPVTGTYHIDIYRGRRQATDALLACGTLMYAGG